MMEVFAYSFIYIPKPVPYLHPLGINLLPTFKFSVSLSYIFISRKS